MSQLKSSLKSAPSSRSKFHVTLLFFLFCGSQIFAQHTRLSSDTLTDWREESADYTNEFFLSAGYNYSGVSFFDVGMRYYRYKNDGQTSLAFGGPAIGCKFGTRELEPIVVPYIGWQGQAFFLAYGIRAEYALWNGRESFAITPELGISFFEIVRITGGYRFGFGKADPIGLDGFTFSAIIGIPFSFLKADGK